MQRKKTTIGTLEVLFGNLGYLVVPADPYRLIIFPSHKTLWMLSPFFLLAILPLYLVLSDIPAILLHMGLSLSVFVLLFLSLRQINSVLNPESHGRHGFSPRSLINTIYYVLLNEYIVIAGWIDFVFKRYSLLWEIVETNRPLKNGDVPTEAEIGAQNSSQTTSEITSSNKPY